MCGGGKMQEPQPSYSCLLPTACLCPSVQRLLPSSSASYRMFRGAKPGIGSLRREPELYYGVVLIEGVVSWSAFLPRPALSEPSPFAKESERLFFLLYYIGRRWFRVLEERHAHSFRGIFFFE